MNTMVVYDIQRLSIHDGPGIRTVIFFKGCPLSCKWCANPESQKKGPQVLWFENMCLHCNKCTMVCPNRPKSQVCLDINQIQVACNGCGSCLEVCIPRARKITGQSYSVNEMVKEVTQDIHFYKRSGGGVTFSGGEPFVQSEPLLELMKRLKAINISTAIETCGFTPYENIHKAVEYLDVIFYDLKHMDVDIHKRFTGVDNKLILDNLKRLSAERRIEQMKNITIRVPLISGINDTDENITATAEFISELPAISKIEFLCYHKLGIPKYRQLHRQYELTDGSAPSKIRLADISELLHKKLRKDIEVVITE